MEVEVFRILVLPGHAGMKGGQAMPAHAPFDLFHGFLFPNQDAHGLAVERIARLELSDGEPGGGGLTHGTASATPTAWTVVGRRVCPRLGAIFPKRPSKLHHAAAHALEHGLKPVVHPKSLKQTLAVSVGCFFTYR